MFFSIYPNGHNFLMQSQVIVKLSNYESTNKITDKYEKKLVSRKIRFLSIPTISIKYTGSKKDKGI